MASHSLVLAFATTSFIAGALLLDVVVARSFIESCNTASQCTSMVAYRTPAKEKLQDVAWLFSVDIVTLLGANNFDLDAADPVNMLIGANQVIKVPITCSCVDGIWRGNSTLYKIRPGDTLSYIADVLFGRLVTYKQIAQANGISNPNNILAGSILVIPFSCGCNTPTGSGNQPSMLLSYVVQSGDTVDKLVRDFASVSVDLMTLNSMSNASDLAPGDVIAVPVHACTSTFRRSAYDFGLMVANGSYVITAGHCVQCSCLPNLQQVYCTPAPASISGTCPDMRCLATNLTIGGMLTAASVDGCNVTSCLYTGFKKRIILSSLQKVTLNSCPAPPPPPTYKSPASGSLAFPPSAAPSTLPGRGTPGNITSSQSAFAPGPSAAGKLTTRAFVVLALAVGLVLLHGC